MKRLQHCLVPGSREGGRFKVNKQGEGRITVPRGKAEAVKKPTQLQNSNNVHSCNYHSNSYPTIIIFSAYLPFSWLVYVEFLNISHYF